MSRSKRNAAAEDYFKRAPNYSAEAIDSLTESVVDSEDARTVVDVVLSILEGGHKFVLPDSGMLLGNKVTLQMIGLSRLPFPQIVIEFPVLNQSDTLAPDDASKFRSSKRIVVCYEYSNHGKDGFIAWAVSYDNANDAWAPMSFGFFVAYRNEDEDPYVRVVSFGVLPEKVLEAYPDAATRQAELLRANQAEMRAVFQLCAALSCTNVTTDVIRPNREARAARPASTLFDYHVLMIRPGAEHATSEDKGGTHASPRTHLRRGHIRRLAWGPRVWVNSCVVNPSAIGTVNKDYRVVC